MGFLTSTKTRTLTQTVINITADQTFCDLIAAMLLASSHFNSALSDLQNQINIGQDTYQTKVNLSDCPGFLADKFQSSPTVAMEILPPSGGCQKIQFNIVDSGGGTVPAPIFDPCETALTAVTIYGTVTNPPGNAVLDKQWQGNVQWNINKLGEINLTGRAFITDLVLNMTSSNEFLTQPMAKTQKVLELPNIPCIEDKIGNTDDYYGIVEIANSHITPSGGGDTLKKISLKLTRVGRSFYAEFNPVIFGFGVFNLEIAFGQLKSLN